MTYRQLFARLCFSRAQSAQIAQSTFPANHGARTLENIGRMKNGTCGTDASACRLAANTMSFVFMPIIAGWRASKYPCVPRPERVSTRPRSDKIRRFPTLFANFPIANWLRSAHSWWQVTFRRCTKCTNSNGSPF